MKTFFSPRDQDRSPPLTAAQRINRTREKLPNKIQTTKTRNMPVHNHHHLPLYTRDYLIKMVYKAGITAGEIPAFLAQLPDSKQNITYTEFYHFIIVILKSVEGKYQRLRKHPVIALLFGRTYLIETFICLRKLSLLDRSNFHAIYLLSEAEQAALCILLDVNNETGNHVTEAQIKLVKQILPYHQPWLHDTLDMLTIKVHPSRTDILNYLYLSDTERKTLHLLLVDLFNRNRLNTRSYRLAYMKISKRLDEGISLLLRHRTFDIIAGLELIQAGGNPHVGDAAGNTILHRYVDNIINNDNPDVCIAALREITLFYRADINVRNNAGQSPWTRFINNRNPDHIEYVEDFLEMGARCTKVLGVSDSYLDFLRCHRTIHPNVENILAILSGKLNALERKYGIDATLHIEPYKIEKLGQIGKGTYGKVYEGFLHSTPIAIKISKIAWYDCFIDELSAMYQLQTPDASPHIIGLKGYDINVKTGYCYMYMELAEQGSLRDLIEYQTPWSMPQRYQLVKDIVQGICFIHAHQFIHADIKSANILVDFKGKAKIGDFGLTDKEKNYTGSYGTLVYKAPELLLGKTNTSKSDIFSLAVTMNEAIAWKFVITLMNLAKNYPNDRLILDILGGFRPRIEPDCPPKVASLITAAWIFNPDDRPDAEQLAVALEEEVTDQSVSMTPGK